MCQAACCLTSRQSIRPTTDIYSRAGSEAENEHTTVFLFSSVEKCSVLCHCLQYVSLDLNRFREPLRSIKLMTEYMQRTLRLFISNSIAKCDYECVPRVFRPISTQIIHPHLSCVGQRVAFPSWVSGGVHRAFI